MDDVARLRGWAALVGSTRTAVIVVLSAIAAGFAVWITLGNSNVVEQAVIALVSFALIAVFFLYVVSGWLQPEPAEGGEPAS